MISAHARTLRTSQLETSNAIAKIHEIRGLAEGFAENMLAKATDGKPPNMDATWSAFSGVLTAEMLDTAKWDDINKKVQGKRSRGVFNITAFQGGESAAPPTPIQHTVLQLTDAKVNAQPTPDGYEASADHSNFLIPCAAVSSAAAGKTCERDRYGDDDDDAASSAPDEDDEDDDNGEYSS